MASRKFTLSRVQPPCLKLPLRLKPPGRTAAEIADERKCALLRCRCYRRKRRCTKRTEKISAVRLSYRRPSPEHEQGCAFGIRGCPHLCYHNTARVPHGTERLAVAHAPTPVSGREVAADRTMKSVVSSLHCMGMTPAGGSHGNPPTKGKRVASGHCGNIGHDVSLDRRSHHTRHPARELTASAPQSVDMNSRHRRPRRSRRFLSRLPRQGKALSVMAFQPSGISNIPLTSNNSTMSIRKPRKVALFRTFPQLESSIRVC
jgi:hypothetical protein